MPNDLNKQSERHYDWQQATFDWYQSSNMARKLWEQTSIFGSVCYVFKSLLGIKEQKPRSHVRILDIECDLLLTNQDYTFSTGKKKNSIFWKRGQMVDIFPGKCSSKSGNCRMSKNQIIERKYWKFQNENQMERAFLGKRFRRFGHTSGDFLPFRELCKTIIFYSGWVLFLRDHGARQTWRRHAFETGFIFFKISCQLFVDK